MYSIYYYSFYGDMSIQELVDCPRNSLTYGCSGGFIEGAMAYMMETGVLV